MLGKLLPAPEALGMTGADDGHSRGTRTVLLGDAHPLFRSGMRYLLQDELAPAEVLDAGSREVALALLERQAFQLVICSLFSLEGQVDEFLDALLQRSPLGRPIVLSSVDEHMLVRRVLVAGAAGYVLMESPPEITLQAIRLVLAGGVYIPPSALSSGPSTFSRQRARKSAGSKCHLPLDNELCLSCLFNEPATRGSLELSISPPER